jgi:hypothetical protein
VNVDARILVPVPGCDAFDWPAPNSPTERQSTVAAESKRIDKETTMRDCEQDFQRGAHHAVAAINRVIADDPWLTKEQVVELVGIYEDRLQEDRNDNPGRMMLDQLASKALGTVLADAISAIDSPEEDDSCEVNAR